MPADTELEGQFAAWRAYAARRQAIAPGDVEELEGHLRDQVEELTGAGLTDDEAFLVAVKRMGRLDDLSHEFAREHSDRLWKQLVIGDRATGGPRPVEIALAIALAVGAGIAIKIPALFGLSFAADGDFYRRNICLLVLPFVVAYFLVRRRCGAGVIAAVGVPFVIVAGLLNGYPFAPDSATEPLAVIHASVALWLVAGISYTGGAWRSGRARMDFIRFTGEWFVYLVLIGLGGGVLAGLTVGVFNAIGLDAEPFVESWMLPCGIAGAVVIAAWLVEVKQGVIENMAPVLTKVFSPLFAVLLLALIVAGLVQRNLIDTQRDLLIIFDLVLLVVLGLLLYSMSARDPGQRPTWFDRLQVLMLASALVVDVLVLIAMIGRIGAYGASANKLASLGLNAILLVNLAGAAVLLVRFLRGRVPYPRLEDWQTSYVPVYLAWAVIVVVVFPPSFGFA